MNAGAANRYDAIVVGAGHNGLVNACYLARAGLKVLVLERNHYIGGAAVSRRLYDGFTYSPRITLGVQQDNWGILGRFWYMSDSTSVGQTL